MSNAKITYDDNGLLYCSALVRTLLHNPIFAACPFEVRQEVINLVQALEERDWDDWSSEVQFNFCETLLFEVFNLPLEAPST